MSKAHRLYEPDQAILMPPVLSNCFPEGHLEESLREVVQELDLYAGLVKRGRAAMVGTKTRRIPLCLRR
jgi:hypothetical protein